MPVPKRVQPPRRFVLQTSQAICEQRALRQVIVEAYDAFAVLRLKGLQPAFPIPWSAIYRMAAKEHAERELRELKARLGVEE